MVIVAWCRHYLPPWDQPGCPNWCWWLGHGIVEVIRLILVVTTVLGTVALAAAAQHG